MLFGGGSARGGVGRRRPQGRHPQAGRSPWAWPQKRHIADAQTTIEATGYAPGGVPPLGHASPLPVLVDASLRRFALVYAAAGAPAAVFPIAPNRLVSAIGGIVLDLCEDNVANSVG
jgi:hypothetical protein